ncbi:MAG: biotin--[acetyl-CoA-carboxylase] ligase [Alphaproteobacteria bacterium]|nr:biotin--[acetyl-CoA-carboxylase] ligase [Alphaproteobacteria bacterium]
MNLPPICHLVDMEETASTNDDACRLAREGRAEGTVVRTLRQTKGRGRQGRVWESEPGNLFMSLVLRPDVAASVAGQLSFCAAVALMRTLQDVLPDVSALRLKWPNDVLIDGKKAAGILLESELSSEGKVAWVVIGMGVNLVTAPDEAVSLKSCSVEVTRDVFFEKLMHNMMAVYTTWQEQGFMPVRDEWLQHAHAVDDPIRVRLPQEEFSGTFRGIDMNGALCVALSDGRERTIASGEVFALEAS